MFDRKYGIALHAMQENQASNHGEGEVSYSFSSHDRNLWYILELLQGWPFETRVCSAKLGRLSSYKGHLRNLLEVWQGNMNTSGGEAGDPVSLSSCNMVIGIHINFQQESLIVTF